MRDFADFHKESVLDGEKVGINTILNKNIEVMGFAERNSRYTKSSDGKYIIIQIRHDGNKYVFFTASQILRQQLSDYRDMLPFRAQIIYNGKYYTFKGSDNEDSTGL